MSSSRRKVTSKESSSSTSTKAKETSPPPVRETGIVATLRDSYGFIDCNDKSESRFFHFSEFPGVVKENLKVGDTVEFLMKRNPKSKKMLATEVIKIPEFLEDSEDRVSGSVLKAVSDKKRKGGKQEKGIIYYKSHGEGYQLPYDEQDWDLPTELPKVGDKVTFIIGCDKGTGDLHARLVRPDPGPNPDQRYRGIVNLLRTKFGFIERKNVTDNLFFHMTEAKNCFHQITIGDEVEFNIKSRKGREVGINVTIVRPAIPSLVSQLVFNDGPGQMNNGGRGPFNDGGRGGHFNDGGGPFNDCGRGSFNDGDRGGPFNDGGRGGSFNDGPQGDRFRGPQDDGGGRGMAPPNFNQQLPRLLPDFSQPFDGRDNYETRGGGPEEANSTRWRYGSVSSHDGHDDRSADGGPLTKRAKKDSADSHSNDGAPQTKSAGHPAVASTVTAERDKFTVFGEHVACQIRDLRDPRRQAMAENRINNILFDVTMEKFETTT